jgi:hypothetical protein
MCYFCNETHRHNTALELLEVGQPCSARNVNRAIWDTLANGCNSTATILWNEFSEPQEPNTAYNK